MTYLFAPKKNKEYSGYKLIPSLNCVCPMTFRTWYNLRKVLMEYGKSSYKRNLC